jgi:3'-phosphoadenosine 5'-phosphosulfate sulfotransferase (PAPS reductase)/FAD synthetase
MVTIKEVLSNLSDKSIRHIVSLSGGKDSAALAIYMKQRYPEIPTEFVFCDTGCELPETYEYLERIEAILGVKVQRVNALSLIGVREKSGRTPFDIWLKEMYGGFLPSPRTRWCTVKLKIEPFEAYVGNDQAFSYIGIRADENRDGYIAKKPPVFSQRPNIIPVYPLKDDNLGLQDVIKILQESGIALPKYYKWRSRSGCYFCFYQQIGEWQGLKEHHPDLFEKAKSYEKIKSDGRFTWVGGRSLDEIANLPKRYPILSAEESLGCAICHL